MVWANVIHIIRTIAVTTKPVHKYNQSGEYIEFLRVSLLRAAHPLCPTHSFILLIFIVYGFTPCAPPTPLVPSLSIIFTSSASGSSAGGETLQHLCVCVGGGCSVWVCVCVWGGGRVHCYTVKACVLDQYTNYFTKTP